MALPVRPIFQNGQRLTAERLNAALDFLRTALRRLSLAPLSAGVAAGLELSPRSPQASDHVTVHPGVGIDGRGRLMVLEFGRSLTAGDIESQVGGRFATGDTVEVRLVLDDGAPDADACGPNTESAVFENARIQLVRTASIDNLPSTPAANCVNPWADLDGSGGACGITLGHVTRDGYGQVQAHLRLRQGVSIQLGRVRNPNGKQALAFGESSTSETGSAEMIRASQPLVVDDQLVSNSRATFHGTASFDHLFGGEVQATHIGTRGSGLTDQVAGLWFLDQRVFVVGGGAGASQGSQNVRPRYGGITAIQCRVHPSFGGALWRAGVPLVSAIDGGHPVVREMHPGDNPRTLVGVSAAPSGFVPGNGVAGSVRVVPIATAGLVQVTLGRNSGFPVGTALTFDSSDPTKLVPSWNETNILARAAQGTDGSAAEVLAWVVHMPQNLVQPVIIA